MNKTDKKPINVAEGVTLCYANIGNEYTSTRVMDKALMDRFTIVEMDVLNRYSRVRTSYNICFPHVDARIH